MKIKQTYESFAKKISSAYHKMSLSLENPFSQLKIIRGLHKNEKEKEEKFLSDKSASIRRYAATKGSIESGMNGMHCFTNMQHNISHGEKNGNALEMLMSLMEKKMEGKHGWRKCILLKRKWLSHSRVQFPWRFK